eukprot:13358710-Heterocapsa_arctica.AAC.1
MLQSACSAACVVSCPTSSVTKSESTVYALEVQGAFTEGTDELIPRVPHVIRHVNTGLRVDAGLVRIFERNEAELTCGSDMTRRCRRCRNVADTVDSFGSWAVSCGIAGPPGT